MRFSPQEKELIYSALKQRHNKIQKLYYQLDFSFYEHNLKRQLVLIMNQLDKLSNFIGANDIVELEGLSNDEVALIKMALQSKIEHLRIRYIKFSAKHSVEKYVRNNLDELIGRYIELQKDIMFATSDHHVF